jgi:hypothetical protein
MNGDKLARRTKEARRRQKYETMVLRLLKATEDLDACLTEMPLQSVADTAKHHEYRTVLLDIAQRAWREIETVDGATDTGKRMALARKTLAE